MAKITSPHWDENTGVCTKHFLPETPCQQCIAERDPDITVSFSEIEMNDPEFVPRDALPEGELGDWLLTKAA